MPPKRKAAEPSVSVLVPWRETPDRAPQWAFLRERWAARFPDWQIVEGSCGDGPWRKAVAVADALSRADGDVIVMADADVWTDGVAEAVQVVESGRARWAVPHYQLRRLSQAATDWTLRHGEFPLGYKATDDEGRDIYIHDQRPYVGFAGGGMVVLTRDLYREAPLDPRFEGWGQEDEAWRCALRVLSGKEWRGTADMWHLWHPKPERMSRYVGNAAGRMLLQRYQRARDGARMRALIAEHQAVPV